MTASPVLVLGMHRSGTSCLAGCLEAGGLELGEVNTAAPFNQKGNRESVPLMKLHDRVLASNGAKWDAPPAGEVDWPEAEFGELRAHVQGFEGKRWGAKDPRALFLLRGWRKVSSPVFVGTFRHPLAVVGSLVTRAEAWGAPMSEETALGVWLAYNTRLLEELDRAPFPLIRYDQPADAYRARLADICRQLGLDADGAFSFYATQLDHHDRASASVPREAEAVWGGLLRRETR